MGHKSEGDRRATGPEIFVRLAFSEVLAIFMHSHFEIKHFSCLAVFKLAIFMPRYLEICFYLI
jgi:hypothetical protein